MSANPNSILDSVKKVLNIGFDETSFDLDVTMFINSAFASLQQLGVGPDDGFSISDNTSVWSSFTSEITLVGKVKTYVTNKVRLIFDPPATSFAIEALKEVLAEDEWRLTQQAEIIRQAQAAGGQPTFIPYWWDLTGLSDFPPEALTGDMGIDFDSSDIWCKDQQLGQAYMWDLTGLSDFPSGSVVGECGIDMSNGNVYRRDA
jgi:hypothetical protein